VRACPTTCRFWRRVAVGLAFAFLGGLAAVRLRLPSLVGYLLAGVAVGPFTPGFVADSAVVQELAEIGVLLLMFGVGMHFSIRELLEVRAVAVPGAITQIVVATALGIVLALRRTLPTALTISAALAQIGEFSFILAALGVTLGLLPEDGPSLVLAGALISITVNPVLFGAASRFQASPARIAAPAAEV
jgi:predicted Kef-type K+ transport protein